jgi:hypothetical protein
LYLFVSQMYQRNNTLVQYYIGSARGKNDGVDARKACN